MRILNVSPSRQTIVGIAAIVALGMATSACSSFSRALGMEKVSPDEFAIVTKAPLVIPPEYNLRPPAPGTVREDLVQPQERAQAALFGPDATPVADGVVTAGEYALLTNTGVGDSDPQIRNVLASEASSLTQKDRGFTDRILFWQGAGAPSGYDTTVIDAAAENERIRNSQATGEPVTSGVEPTIVKDRGIF